VKSKDPIILDLTQSRIGSFLSCPRKEYYQYRAATCGLERDAPYIPFLEGEFGHYALAHYHRKGRMLRSNLLKKIERIQERLREDYGKAYTPEIDNKIRKSLAAISGACLGYKVRYASDAERYEVLFVEEPFQVELDVKVNKETYRVVLQGKIDRVMRDKETDQIIFWENKFLASLPKDSYTAVPLNLQGLIYCLGAQSLMEGEMPDARQWDFIIKSKLSIKQTKGGVESLAEFENRVTQQYLDEPEKKFFRFPPQIVHKVVINNVVKQLSTVIGDMAATQAGDREAYMNWNSCLGIYGQACPFIHACKSKLLNHKDGWDAAENQGMYRKKIALHEELMEDKDGEK